MMMMIVYVHNVLIIVYDKTETEHTEVTTISKNPQSFIIKNIVFITRRPINM